MKEIIARATLNIKSKNLIELYARIYLEVARGKGTLGFFNFVETEPVHGEGARL
jgi:hypothetical protein